MKKSKMVYEIEKIMDVNLNIIISRKKAEVLLTKLEALGMLPPEIDSGLYNRSDCSNYWVSEWEEESV